MADQDVSMSSPPQSSDASGASSQELNVHTRLTSLCALDEQITQILERGSAIAQAVAEGKLPNDAEAKRTRFSTAVQEYNKLVEEVNGKLRREVKLLHDASHTQLLPLYIPVQAASFGREKEDMIYESLAELPPSTSSSS